MVMMQITGLKGCRSRLTVWAGQVRQSLDRELHALQVNHQDAAFLATGKGDAYQHIVAKEHAFSRA